MLPIAGYIHCLDGENNSPSPSRKQSCTHHHTLTLTGDKGKGLICVKEEGKLLAEKMQKYTPPLPDTGKKKGC